MMESKTWLLPKPVGIDVGITNVAVLSDGTVYDNTHEFMLMLDEFRKNGVKLSKTMPNTKGYEMTKSHLNHKYRRMVNKRKDYLEKTSLKIVKDHTIIIMENLSIKGLKSISKSPQMTVSYDDCSLGKLRQRICSKAMEAGRQIVFVDPKNTSQMCSGCGAIVHKELSDRVHKCLECGLKMDRDLNASLNILRLGLTNNPSLASEGRIAPPFWQGHEWSSIDISI
jgi:putative transposase